MRAAWSSIASTDSRTFFSPLPLWGGSRSVSGNQGNDEPSDPGFRISDLMAPTKRIITLIPGDGIGPEVTRAVVRILEASGFKPEWETFSAGAEAVKEHGTTLPQPLLDSITRNKIALKGPITTPIGKGLTSVNLRLPRGRALYATLRPVWNLPSVPSRFQGVDLVIVRENTEDLYAGLEHTVVPGVVESLKIITEKASTRIAHFAFKHARRNGRKRVPARP